ncbi:hypothetical protein BJX62DRAFT_213904 [Aspergillus germanicus]
MQSALVPSGIRIQLPSSDRNRACFVAVEDLTNTVRLADKSQAAVIGLSASDRISCLSLEKASRLIPLCSIVGFHFFSSRSDWAFLTSTLSVIKPFLALAITILVSSLEKATLLTMSWSPASVLITKTCPFLESRSSKVHPRSSYLDTSTVDQLLEKVRLETHTGDS